MTKAVLNHSLFDVFGMIKDSDHKTPRHAWLSYSLTPLCAIKDSAPHVVDLKGPMMLIAKVG